MFNFLACPLTGCKMYCEYGFVKDKNGCQKCECAPKPRKILILMIYIYASLNFTLINFTGDLLSQLSLISTKSKIEF